MATRKAKATKTEAAAIEAPVGWDQLLREAIERPGLISEAFSRFHSYSLGNALLVTWQCLARGLDLGPVASYKRWAELGRQVKKGQESLLICMPRPFTITETDPQTGEKVTRHLKKFVYRRAVFVLAQTERIDGQEDRSATLSALTEDWSAGRAMAAIGVTPAPYRMMDGNCAGYFDPEKRTIALSPVGTHPERTLLHELGHAVLHPTGYDAARGVCEFEAEAVAMLASHALGLGGMDESRGYCQHWLSKISGQFDLTEAMARRIFSTAQKLIAAGRPSSEQEAAVA
jgi:antirestriction protein ArdC